MSATAPSTTSAEPIKIGVGPRFRAAPPDLGERWAQAIHLAIDEANGARLLASLGLAGDFRRASQTIRNVNVSIHARRHISARRRRPSHHGSMSATFATEAGM
jgi:hypothetical protein